MKKQHLIVALSVLTVVGSLFMMLSSNMFFSDILNAGAGGLLGSLSVSLPAISVTMFFVIAVLYLLRLYKKPGCKKRLTRLYSILLMVLAFLGILGDILGGATYYKTFVGPNPFPGYLIIFLILNLLLLGGSIFALIKATKMEADAEKTRIGFPYVMKTLGWFLFI
nr:hypothetical protein [Bacilli bacterium]